MLRCLFRLVVLVILIAVAIVAFILLAPRFINQAGNSLLNAFSNSAASGLAQFIPANFNDQNNHLQISVNGLTNADKYYVTLDSGTCGGSPSINLGSVTADNSGSINQLLKVPTKFDTSQTWYIDIHEGNGPTGRTLACGQLVINSNSVAMESTPILTLSPDTGQVSAPTIANGSPTPDSTPQTGFPNTGVQPGTTNSYDNYVYPRKY
jgi:hypothetical protein